MRTKARFNKPITTAMQYVTVALCVFVLQSCGTTNSNQFGSTFGLSAEQREKESNNDSPDGMEKDNNEFNRNTSESLLNPMDFKHDISGQTSSEVLQLSDVKDIAIAFDEVDLKEFVNHSLANLLNVNFVIDPVTPFNDKKVTLSIKEKISQKRFMELFKDVLEQNGLAFKIQNDVLFLFGNKKRRGLPDYDYGYGRDKAAVPVGAQPIFQVVPIDFIDPKSLASFIIRLSNASPEQVGDPNKLGVRGKRHDILRALDLIEMLDVPSVRGQKLLFIKLEFLPSGEFVKKVTELLDNEGVNVENAMRFTDLTRQNGVIVHSNNDKILERVSFWRKQLDTPDASDDRQYFMYYPENMEAEKLAEVLEKLVQVGRPGGAQTQSGATTATPTTSTPGVSGTAANSGSAGFSEDFSYVTDENRNVIIIYSTASKYKSILPLLKKLDVTPPQVLVEAKLIEITLTDQHSQGIQWSLFGGSRKRDIAVSQLTSFNNGSFSYSISGIDYSAALSALQSQDRLKVLSSPRIVVANGESASLNVGTEIPVLSTQAADVDSDRVLQSIQYRSTGVDLTVKPTVNSSNVISMTVSQNVSETSENASSGIDSPLILNRSFNTSIIANSGQTLVLGGLIRENNSGDESQVPVLGDIPVLGKAFSTQSSSKSRTELVVLITPRIISNSSDIDDIKKLFIDELTLFD